LTGAKPVSGTTGHSSEIECSLWEREVAGLIPAAPTWRHLNTSKHYKIIMSLISQKDRDLAIEALDFYLFNKKFDFTEAKRAEVNALLNWIKLEYQKHDN